MSRGGRGGGRGGRRGPDLSWDDEETPPTPISNKPEPLFSDIDLPTPKPLDQTELSSIKHYLGFRDRTRNGTFHATLEPSGLADENGKVDKRLGFDPFNDQEKYTTKYHKKRRTVPDLSGRDYALKLFPRELWSTLDPKHKHPVWKTMAESSLRPSKRKRVLAEAEDDEETKAKSESDTDDSDDVVTSSRKRDMAKSKRDGPKTKEVKQKQGLDAEDDYPEIDQNENEDGEGEDEPVDSEFSESDDGVGDDYNAENYFDTGENDDDDGGGGDDEGGYY